MLLSVTAYTHEFGQAWMETATSLVREEAQAQGSNSTLHLKYLGLYFTEANSASEARPGRMLWYETMV